MKEIHEWLIVDYSNDPDDPLLNWFVDLMLKRRKVWGLFYKDNKADKCVGFMLTRKKFKHNKADSAANRNEFGKMHKHITIKLFSIAPDHRRNGLGRKLFVEPFLNLIDDIDFIKLDPRDKAISFWTRLGFTKIGDAGSKMILSVNDFRRLYVR
ncbi:Hypothetical protein HVR_LOCUS805 [uncultured virus]|nr:Hypothetical protein HVR_LOCUS805 [uncultured virus]